MPLHITRRHYRPFFFIFALAILFCHAPASALELGSTAPAFSLKTMDGDAVQLRVRGDSPLLILHFFDPSKQGLETLAQLGTAAEESSGAFSLLGISMGNPEAAEAVLDGGEELAPILLLDNRGVTFAYGLRGKLPATIILGPGERVAAIILNNNAAHEILLSAADALISMGFPGRAGGIYRSIPAGHAGAEAVMLGKGYAALLSHGLADGPEGALSIFKSISAGSASLSPEAHAAIGWLEFRRGRDGAAKASCARALNAVAGDSSAGGSFAEYVMGMAEARSGRCNACSKLLRKTASGRFMFRWQEALAKNMAARVAEESGERAKARKLYREAALLAPLSPAVNANLLAHHWASGNYPAADRYARILKALDSADSSDTVLTASLANEYEAQVEFNSDPASRKRLEKKLKKSSEAKSRIDAASSGRSGGGSSGGALAVEKGWILIPDISISGCCLESNSLPIAGAGILRRGLETGGFAAISRPEMLVAMKYLGIAGMEMTKPAHLLKAARALSADFVTLSEVANYEGAYLVNIRIADVASGEIVAVAFERIASLDDLAATIERLALSLCWEPAFAQSGG